MMVGRKTIAEVFSSFRAGGQIALMPFIPAGYPTLDVTAALLPAMETGGASLIEIGFPFSDPIADGPTIQAAFTASLAAKIKVDDVFATVESVRGRVSIPLVAMVSYSIVYRYGLQRFIGRAKAAGFDGLIIPDLPVPEGDKVCEAVRAVGLDTVLFVAPATSPERKTKALATSSGFVYYLSVSGITGQRDTLPADLAENVRWLKDHSPTPVCVGFGIHTAEQVADLAKVADGAIVGSAVVSVMNRHLDDSTAAIAAAVEGYCRELLRLSR